MKFISHLYLGKTVKKKPEKLVARIRKKKLMINTYVICLAENREDPLEYYKTVELKKSWYDSHEPVIVGIAKGEEETIELIAGIINDCMQKTGGLDLRSFLLSSERNGIGIC